VFCIDRTPLSEYAGRHLYAHRGVPHHGSGCPSPRKAYLLKQELAMRIAQTRLTLDTKPREIKEITSDVARWVAGCSQFTSRTPRLRY
jgi:hypothetical protein